MRNPIPTAIAMLLCLSAITGCIKMAPATNEQSRPDNCIPVFPEQHVTYENYVRGILATHCTPTCHRGGNTPGTGDFTTYEGVLLHSGDIFYYRVIQDNADMPQDNAPLPKDIRDSLNTWIKNCAPEQ